MNGCDPERTAIEHDNRFTMVNTRALKLGTNSYVLPSQCEKVFYLEVPRKAGWSYIVRYDQRGRLVKYNVDEEDNVEEEDNVDRDKVAVDVLDEEAKEVDHPNVGDNVLIDDIDDDITKNDVDNDVDMNDTFNDIDFEVDHDTKVEQDEENDE